MHIQKFKSPLTYCYVPKVTVMYQKLSSKNNFQIKNRESTLHVLSCFLTHYSLLEKKVEKKC